MAELSALLAVGALAPEAVACVRRGVESAGAAVRAEAEAHAETAAVLAEAPPPIDPPEGLKRRLMARLDSTPQRPSPTSLDEDGIRILHSEAIPWQPHSVPGIAFKLLHGSREDGRLTSLVRMDAGATYPAHAHTLDEELVVLSGEVDIHGRRMGPGDYCRAEPGSRHGIGRAASEAVLLIRNSVHDRFLQDVDASGKETPS